MDLKKLLSIRIIAFTALIVLMIFVHQYLLAVAIATFGIYRILRDISKYRSGDMASGPIVTFDVLKALSMTKKVQEMFVGKSTELAALTEWGDVQRELERSFNEVHVQGSGSQLADMAALSFTRKLVEKSLDIIAVRFVDGSSNVSHLPMGVTKSVKRFIDVQEEGGIKVQGQYQVKRTIGLPIMIMLFLTLGIVALGIMFG